MSTARNKEIDFTVEDYQVPHFSIGYRILRFFKKITLKIRQKQPGIRIEAVLTGEITGDSDGRPVNLKAGQYRLTESYEFTALFKKNSACSYFLTHFSSDLLHQIGIQELVKPSPVKPLTKKMADLIQQILHNLYQEKLLAFHHDNCIRELLKLHLTQTGDALPGELSDSDLASTFTADALLQKDLTQHDDIATLAAKSGTNEFKLKLGFQKVFDMGVFERLTFHRMEYAKVLLLTSNRTIDDIAGKVGYSSRNSFITAFKNNIGVTPKRWKVQYFDG